MIKYSFDKKYSNCSLEEVKNFLEITDKPIKYTYGLKYRHPSIYEVPITKEDAIKYLMDNLTDVEEKETFVDVNSFSDNDMW